MNFENIRIKGREAKLNRVQSRNPVLRELVCSSPLVVCTVCCAREITHSELELGHLLASLTCFFSTLWSDFNRSSSRSTWLLFWNTSQRKCSSWLETQRETTRRSASVRVICSWLWETMKNSISSWAEPPSLKAPNSISLVSNYGTLNLRWSLAGHPNSCCQIRLLQARRNEKRRR